MLSKRRCPHTGVVNFFFDADPHIAVGSVVEGEERKFFWRCYTEPYVRAGLASDIKSAERHVVDLCRRAAESERPHRCAAA